MRETINYNHQLSKKLLMSKFKTHSWISLTTSVNQKYFTYSQKISGPSRQINPNQKKAKKKKKRELWCPWICISHKDNHGESWPSPSGAQVATSTVQKRDRTHKVSEKNSELPKEQPQNQNIKHCAIYSGEIKAFKQKCVVWSQCFKACLSGFSINNILEMPIKGG